MIKRNQDLSSGDNSKNYQAMGNISISGVSYTEAKEIAIDVFNQNFPKLVADAQKTILERINEIINKIVDDAIKTDKSILNNLSDPGVQLSLYEVQKGYSKSGDKNLLNILSNLFIKRLSSVENSLENIVTEEAILKAPKLTESQMNTIAFIYRLKYIRNEGLNKYEDIKWLIENKLIPISKPLPTNGIQFKHLAYTGIAIYSNTIASGIGLTGELFNLYNGALQRGFMISEIPDKIKGIESEMLKEDDDKYYFKEQNITEVKIQLENLGYKPEFIGNVRNFLFTTIMQQHFLQAKLEEEIIGYEEMFKNWDIIDSQHMSLTSVGVVLAETYLTLKGIEDPSSFQHEIFK